jgi:putative ABC transport system permease protein
MPAPTRLAWHNLRHQPVRSGVAVLGVTFAAVLMFMQLGFLEAVKASATVIYDVLRFDICIRSRDYDRLSDARSFDRLRLADARGVAGVEAAAPLWIGMFSWRNPDSGEPRAILALGTPHAPRVFDSPALESLVSEAQQRPKSLLIDSLTRREFGPAAGAHFSEADLGRGVEINDRRLEIAGVYRVGTGLNAGGAIILPEREFLACQPLFPAEQVSFGLVQIRRGSDPEAVARELRRALPDDVEVLSRRDVLKNEIARWVWETNYGLIFQSGVLVAVIVGTAIVYQVLASEVSARMPEYATLKAMGYGNRYLARMMAEQSLLLALIAFIFAWAIAAVLYQITAVGAQIPIRMTFANWLIVLTLTIGLCVLSGLAAIRKAFRADPAELF